MVMYLALRRLTTIWPLNPMPILLAFMMIASCLPTASLAQKPDFSAWLETLRAEARDRGIRPEILEATLSDISYLPRVIELDQKQPESTMTYARYIQLVMPQSRIQKGQQLFQKHRELLKAVSAKYGVPASVIVALWGIESDYGRHTGGFSVVPALATLAYDGRRGAYFRKELFDALKILHDGHIAPEEMTGSWAGAMGQNQFMPSSFLSHAVDHNNDDRRDIWNSLEDIFASTANYLARAGWRKGELWGRQVKLPANFDLDLVSLKTQKPLAAWQALGVRRASGRHLPTVSMPASIVMPAAPEEPAFLVYNNYRVFLKWNRSTYFALAVGQLANHIENNSSSPSTDKPKAKVKH